MSFSKKDSFWVWGKHSVEQAILCCPESILDLHVLSETWNELSPTEKNLLQNSGIRFQKVPRMPKLLEEHRHQGLAAHIKSHPGELFSKFREKYTEPPKGTALLLDRIEDVRNFGAILRSAAAFDIQAVFLGKEHQAPVNGVVAQASAGHVFRIPLVLANNLSQVVSWYRECHQEVWSMAADGEDLQKAILAPMADSLLLILGSEGRGVRPQLMQNSSKTVRIEQNSEIDSLNVSVATGIALYSIKNKQSKV